MCVVLLVCVCRWFFFYQQTKTTNNKPMCVVLLVCVCRWFFLPADEDNKQQTHNNETHHTKHNNNTDKITHLQKQQAHTEQGVVWCCFVFCHWLVKKTNKQRTHEKTTQQNNNKHNITH